MWARSERSRWADASICGRCVVFRDQAPPDTARTRHRCSGRRWAARPKGTLRVPGALLRPYPPRQGWRCAPPPNTHIHPHTHTPSPHTRALMAASIWPPRSRSLRVHDCGCSWRSRRARLSFTGSTHPCCLSWSGRSSASWSLSHRPKSSSGCGSRRKTFHGTSSIRSKVSERLVPSCRYPPPHTPLPTLNLVPSLHNCGPHLLTVITLGLRRHRHKVCPLSEQTWP